MDARYLSGRFSPTKRESKYSALFLKECREHWNAGLSITEIGRRFSVSRNVIIGVVHRNEGFTPRGSPIRPLSDVPSERCQEILALLEGRSCAQAARAIGVSRKYVWSVARRWAPERIRPRRKYKPETIDTIRKLWLSALPRQEIANFVTEHLFPITANAINGLAYRHRFPPHPSRTRREAA